MRRLVLLGLLAASLACEPPAGDTLVPCNADGECEIGEACLAGYCQGISGPGDGGATDGGARDAGFEDAGATDAGTNDAGASDAGASDAGASDAGASDAGASDAGASDAGASDAGASDAGASDAGASDAGFDGGYDAGFDGGFDGGYDGGYDAGYDAGPPPPVSCAEIHARDDSLPSGMYAIISRGTELSVYCEMQLRGGGWTRVIRRDFANGADCPNGWLAVPSEGVCARDNDSISEATFGSPIIYQEVLGTAVGRQFGSPDAFGDEDVGGPYVDGLSLTVSSNNSQVHVWSFAIGLMSDGQSLEAEPENLCPCNAASTNVVPAFVGTNYFCQTGSVGYPGDVWLPADVWDEGASDGSCADGTSPRWFQRNLNALTASPITARLMADQNRANEDVGVRYLELYVR